MLLRLLKVSMLIGPIYQPAMIWMTLPHISLDMRELPNSSDANAVRLGALLSGKVGKICSSLSPDIVSDHTLLKKSLLRSFCNTPDGLRVDFRSSKIQP